MRGSPPRAQTPRVFRPPRHAESSLLSSLDLPRAEMPDAPDLRLIHLSAHQLEDRRAARAVGPQIVDRLPPCFDGQPTLDEDAASLVDEPNEDHRAEPETPLQPERSE